VGTERAWHGCAPDTGDDVVSLWLLAPAVIVVVAALLLVPRLRKDPPHASGPAPTGSTEDGADGLTRSSAPPDRHPGPPTMGEDPKGPPAP
jgi:hypothetical protein